MQYVTVVIDPSLLEDAGGAVLLTRLQELNAKTAVESQPIPGCITWKRQVMQHNLGDDLQVITDGEDTRKRVCPFPKPKF